MRAKLCGLQSIPQVVTDMTLEEKLSAVIGPAIRGLSRIWKFRPFI